MAMDKSAAPRDSRKVPPLGWLILAILVIIGAVMVFGPDKIRTTPQGAALPAVSAPNVPATGQAPTNAP